MWSPSSLIFLVLLGVWAAYFLQYWIRRRDHLATARSVEQFSEAMRVLEKRDATPRTDLSDPEHRSWTIHPAPASRPQVLVKRAVPAEPATARPVTISQPVAEPAWARPAPLTPSAPRPAGPRREAPAASGAPRRTAPGGVSRGEVRVRPGRRARVALMLLALVELVTIGVLVPLGSLPGWALAPSVLALVLSFGYVRAGVRAEQTLRATRRRASQPTRRTVTASVPTVRAVPRRPAAPPAAPEEAGPLADPAAAGPAQREVSPDPAVAGVVGDEAPAGVPTETPAATGAAAEAEAEMVEEIHYVHLVDEDDIPLTWDPVPVPRPTYTMKARAERPEVPPAEVTPSPVPVALAADQVDERRAAGA